MNEINFNGDKVSYIATERILLSFAAVSTIRNLLAELQEAYGQQTFEESYWLKANGDLMYKASGQIPEAIAFCRIDPNHWNVEGVVQ